MPSTSILRSVEVVRTPRVMQVEGIFDVPPSERSEEHWQVDLELPEEWNVGLIVGPSGSGKSTVARELFADSLSGQHEWPEDKSVLDGFPSDMSIKEIVALLSSVGFSSPPSWVRPFRVLSNGEQFRVSMARTLAEMPSLAVVDEFTSVVDRTVAQIGSAAIAKTVRRRGQKFIAVSCHYDIAEWLEPDWIYEPHVNKLARDCLRRPPIELEVKRVHRDVWELFRKHHYLDSHLHTGAICFCAFWKGRPVAFTGCLHFPHSIAKNIKREHRTVCLPDFQGVGIGNALSAYVGSIWRGLGFRFQSQTSNPAMIHARARSPLWRMIAKPTREGKTLARKGEGISFSRKRDYGKSSAPSKRLRASFEYVGPSLPADEAQRIAQWQADRRHR